MNKKVVSLDVRPDIESGREPFSRIIQTVSGLQPDEKLLLIAPFEPVPLFGVMTQKGFSHRATERQDGAWEVLFERPEGGAGAEPQKVYELDARGLEPPQPLVTILEAVALLPAGAELRARTDRRPMHLYSQLEKRGYQGESEEQDDGSFITSIRKN